MQVILKSEIKLYFLGFKKKDKKSSNPFYLDNKNNVVNSGPVSTFSKFSLVSKNRVYKMPKKMPMDIAALFGCAIPTGFGIILKNIKKLKKMNLLEFMVLEAQV